MCLIKRNIILVCFVGVLLFPILLFSQNSQLKESIERAQNYIEQSDVKNKEKNIVNAINELNTAVNIAVDFPTTHYLLGYCYWTLCKKTKKYQGQNIGLYDYTLLVKSYFHFTLYLYYSMDEKGIEEVTGMINRINSVYGNKFSSDNKIIDDFFSEGIIESSEKLGTLCYSLALESEKNNNNNKAAAYFSLVCLFNSTPKQISYSQERNQYFTSILKQEEKKQEKQIKVNTRKTKPQRWLNDFSSNLYYSYLFQTPLAKNSNYLHGIQVVKLNDRNIGYFFSVTSNRLSIIPQRNANKYINNGDATVIEESKKLTSSYLSAGITRKLYSPFFLTIGVGTGLTTHSSRYMINSSSSEQTQELWLTDFYSWSISPEIGFVIAFPFPLYLTANVKYIFPVKNNEKPSYNNFMYSFGLGLTLPRPPSRRFFVMYNMEFPRTKKIDIKEAFKENDNMMGLIIGATNGVYFSIRANKQLFYKKEKYLNLSDKGRFFFTTGYEQRIFYPLHIYAGLGIAYQQIYDAEFKRQVNLNVDFGLSLQISYLRFRLGMTVPKFDIKDSYLAFGIGANF
jgi:hypothetical protein